MKEEKQLCLIKVMVQYFKMEEEPARIFTIIIIKFLMIKLINKMKIIVEKIAIVVIVLKIMRK